MNPKAIELLEFPAIRAQLASYCGFSLSKALAEELDPSSDGILVARRIAFTSEAVRVLNVAPNLSVGGARDIRGPAERGRRGGVLDPQELLAIQATIGSGRTVRSTVSRLDGLAPGLADLAYLMVDCPALDREIGRCLSDTGDVLDSASPELGRIRSDIRSAHQKLLDRLHDIIYGGTYRTALQEPLITMREGRYVVPVKSEARGQLRGLIHDQSSSGQTVYVEPMVTVELNNRWRQLQMEETHEIERILRVLSEMVGRDADHLVSTVGALGDIDLHLAKARLAEAQRAVEPLLEIRPTPGQRRSAEARAADAATTERSADAPRGLRLINARHPLLHGNVVPITVRLGDEFSVMVITGPNTGGKTVALKTAGLLTLMAQAGMHVPATSGSQIHVFDDILADIGDEQSIEQSLSTFSSHMRNVVGIVKSAGKNTLALLDEVGAGTDPAEGSALARAILRRLLVSGAWTIATTHYTELKAFAHDTQGLTNASVEFNSETLAPTYRLLIGLPGKSNALAIARRLGLDDDVVEDARQMVDTGQLEVENLVAGLQADRQNAEQILAGAESERKEARRLRTELEQRLKNVEDERREIIRRSRREAEAELADLRARLREAAVILQRQDRSRGELATVAEAIEVAGRQVFAKPLPGAPTPSLPSIQGPRHRGPLGIGDAVRINSLNQEGRVTGLLNDGDQVEVQLGNFKLKAAKDDVEWIDRPATDKQTGYDYTSPTMWNTAQRSIPELQLDMRGWRAEQVVPELDRYLNDAYMSGLPTVRIVHGKGTGVLRQIVRDYLARTRLIDRFEVAEAREGGEGATVAHLAL